MATMMMRSMMAVRMPRVAASAAAPMRSSAWASRMFAVKVGEPRFTKEHEYIVLTSATTARVGITDFAQKELGDVVYVDLPDTGKSFAKGDSFGSVESVKAASNIYAPVDLKVTEVNGALRDDSALLNRAAETDAWLITGTVSNPAQLDALLDAAAYQKHCEESKH